MKHVSKYNSFFVEEERNGTYRSAAGNSKFLPISAVLIAFLSGFNSEELNVPQLKPQRPLPSHFAIGEKNLVLTPSLMEEHVFWYTVDELTLFDYESLPAALPGQWFELINVFRQIYTPATRVYFIFNASKQ